MPEDFHFVTSTGGGVGLYDPADERDACGVGFVCRLDGTPSHAIVAQGLQILERLEHRGACGCDGRTGDGAGILLQVPHEFVVESAREVGARIPGPGQYAVGVVLLPRNESQRRYRMAVIEEAVRSERQCFLGWRRVPTDNESVGSVSRGREPEFWHIYVGRGRGLTDQADFERRLFLIRKEIERRLAISGDPFGGAYVASLSSRTLVYKGMLTPDQLARYFPDLRNPALKSAMAMVHSRFSTNTLPRWPLAQPFRFIAHNGEINTLRGNKNWMRARESTFGHGLFDVGSERLRPVLTEGGSDSQNLDNALELLCLTGRSLPHAVMMLIPEAWEHNPGMSDARRAFYEYHSCLMEPWDGPATISFTDGRYVGAVLDRNGLRPSRYTVTHDGLVVMASETGVLDIAPDDIREQGRLSPGKMFLVDLEEKRIVSDDEIKEELAGRRPYREWLDRELVLLSDIDPSEAFDHIEGHELLTQQRMFGYSLEDIRLLIRPMILSGGEALGSMG
ncbi:MAG: glutamate synthase subunit alpha, partial [Rhodothermales bacterium]|nr:glutamate synthase subunit alpha [Rhodothermales bacterium]